MDISSLLEVQVQEGKPSDLHTNGEIEDYKNIPDFSIRVSTVGDVVTYNRKFSATITHDERHYYKLMFGSDIASVRFRKLHCTSCDVHIGSAPAEAHNMHEHPILHVLLCTSCRNFYGDGTFEQGDDATDMFCRWCANGGNLYCCSYCSNTFCYACIKRNFDPVVRKKIERDEKWKCFVCNPADLYTARAACWALLQHVQTVTRILQSDRKMSPAEIEAKMNLDESQCCPHKRKRADTPSDDEEEDETYTVPKRKRRKILNARRTKRRLIKLEIADPSPDGVSAESENPRQPRSNRVRVGLNFPRNSENPSEVKIRQIGDLENDKTPDDNTPKTRRRLRSGAANRSIENDRSNFSIHDDDIPPPLLQCDQSMIEGAESLSFSSLSPGNRNAGSSASRMGITPVPTAHLLKRPVQIQTSRGGKDHRVIRAISGTPVLVRKLPNLAPNITQSVSNAKVTGVQSMPMVSIPSRNHMPQSPNRINVMQPQLQPTTLVRNAAGNLIRQVRSRVLFAKPMSNPNIPVRNPPKNLPPSVIDLDSDEDEPTVLKEPSNDRVSKLSTTTYPVRPDDGLLTILSPTPKSDAEQSGDENNDGDTTDEARQRRQESAHNFEIATRGSTKSIDAVLDTLKTKLKKVMESAINSSPDKELIAAKAKTRTVNHTIKRTVAELTSLSDNLIRAYRAYKGECDRENVTRTPSISLQKREKSSKLTTLDMRCIRDSEPESDQLTSDSDSDTSQDITSVREMMPYRTRVHRAVEARPETEDKAVQVDEIITEDYDKSIGYALLLKADYDPKRERDILRPVAVPDENFGKYEEEFISYLQYLEDRRNDENETDEVDESVIVSVKDLVETDLFGASKATDETETINSSEINDEQNKKTNDDVEIFDEHLEISIPTTGTQSSSSDSDSDSSSSDSETGTSEMTSPTKTDTKEIQEEEKNETQETEMETSVTEESKTENEEKEEKEEATPSENNGSKIRLKPAEEETILAVRALIDDDSSENSNSNAAIKPWKPVESDDECTVLD